MEGTFMLTFEAVVPSRPIFCHGVWGRNVLAMVDKTVFILDRFTQLGCIDPVSLGAPQVNQLRGKRFGLQIRVTRLNSQKGGFGQ